MNAKPKDKIDGYGKAKKGEGKKTIPNASKNMHFPFLHNQERESQE